MSELENAVECAGIIDSHAHYFDRRFDSETDGADAVLTRDVFGRGVRAVVNIGTRAATNALCVAEAKKYPNMYAAVGIHPEDAELSGIDIDSELCELEGWIRDPNKRKENKIVALGEMGLDYHMETFDRELQVRCFDAQMSLAEKYGLPVIIHDREAHGDCFETVLRYPCVTGVFHSYSGSSEMARELVKRGWYISFSGVLTFKNARRVREVAETVPSDRILIETDAPYLAPVPYRGRINHSGLMGYTAQTLAEIRGISTSEAIELTAANAIRLFGIDA